MKTLRMKILSGFTTILVLLVIVSGVAYYSINTSNNVTKELINEDLKQLQLINELKVNVADQIGLIRGYLAYGTSKFKDNIYTLQEESTVLEEQLLASSSNQNHELIKGIVETKDRWEDKLDQIVQAYDQDPQLGLQVATEAVSITEELDGEINNLIDKVDGDMAESGQTIISHGHTSATIIAIISVLAIAIGIFLAMFLTNMIVKPIKKVVERVEEIAKGNLMGDELKVKSKDEVGVLTSSVNEMVASLRNLIGELNASAENLAASAEEISASTDEIAKGSQQQAGDASSSSEMAKEMANAVQAVSQNAEQAAQLTETTLEAASEGGEVIHGTVEGMKEISRKINDLSSKSVQIGEIIEVIDDIAEQTNLLALNAAIEAARAGEAGKGFAVVADEVRKLAERSSKATREISDLIQSIQENTEESVKAVDEGNERTNKAGNSFKEIIKLVRDSANKVSEIAAASEEQASQSSEVQLAVENIASVSEQTSASVQETATTASELAKMSETLNGLASKFKL